VREPEIAFACPSCGGEATCGVDGAGTCTRCQATASVETSESIRTRKVVDRCTACDGEQFYVQRDFNQRAGLVIVIIGGLLAPFTPYYSSLFVAALIDAGLYAVLPEITICYRCKAHYRGFERNPAHQAFDLHVEEQYTTPLADD
jgi:hypothetical protein